MRVLFLAMVMASAMWADAWCGANGKVTYNPFLRQMECTGLPGAGSGTVTSVTIQGTANQITVSGCTITTSGTCTLSIALPFQLSRTITNSQISTAMQYWSNTDNSPPVRNTGWLNPYLAPSTRVDLISQAGGVTGSHNNLFLYAPLLKGISYTTTGGAITASGSPQSILVGRSDVFAVNDVTIIDPGTATQESVTITAIADGTHATAIFSQSHSSGVRWYTPGKGDKISFGIQMSNAATATNNNIYAQNNNVTCNMATGYSCVGGEIDMTNSTGGDSGFPFSASAPTITGWSLQSAGANDSTTGLGIGSADGTGFWKNAIEIGGTKNNGLVIEHSGNSPTAGVNVVSNSTYGVIIGSNQSSNGGIWSGLSLFDPTNAIFLTARKTDSAVNADSNTLTFQTLTSSSAHTHMFKGIGSSAAGWRHFYDGSWTGIAFLTNGTISSQSFSLRNTSNTEFGRFDYASTNSSIYGGGSNNELQLFSTVGGTGTKGKFRFRDNSVDNTDFVIVDTNLLSMDWKSTTTPGSNPASGYFRPYFKTGTGFCYLNSAGAETCPAGGSVTSITASNGVATGSGFAITTTGSLQATLLPNSQTGTSYTILAGDWGKLVTLSNASAIAVTLPQAGGSFPNGFFFDAENRGAGTVTITPTTSTIDGSSSLALTTNQGVRIASDGTNYFTQRGVGGGGSATTTLNALQDVLPVSRTSSTILTIGGTCSASVPCNVRVGSNVVAITGSATATVSAGTGTAWIWVDNSGNLIVGNNLTVACSAGCTQTAATGFPTSNMIPIYTWTATSGTWDSSGGVTYKSALAMDKPIVAGTGISITETATSRTITNTGSSSSYIMGASIGGAVQVSAGPSFVAYAVAWGGIGTLGVTEVNRQLACPQAMTISKLYLVTQSAQPGDGNLIITFRKNAADQAVTVTLAAGAAAGTYSDTTHSFSCTAGDLIDLSLVNNSASASAFINGWAFSVQ